jgi:hypothetical protein
VVVVVVVTGLWVGVAAGMGGVVSAGVVVLRAAVVGLAVLLLLLGVAAAPSSSCMQRPRRQLQLLGGAGKREGHRRVQLADRQQQVLVRRGCLVHIWLVVVAAAGKCHPAGTTPMQVRHQPLGPRVPLQQQQQQGQEVGLGAV